MDIFRRRAFTIPIVRDRAVEALSFGAICGAVLCAGIAGGVEAAGAAAVFAVRTWPRYVAGRCRELRVDGDAWTVAGGDGTVTAIEPPVPRLVHRALVVLEVSGPDRPGFLVFSRAATAPDDLRRLRIGLRAGGLSR